MTDFRPIADKLYQALKMLPCRCIWIGSWPAFKPVKAFPESTCSRCAAMKEYEAHL